MVFLLSLGVAFTGTLNLGRLVTCELNPLKAILPHVAVSFVKAAHIHQISYCQTILHRNQRATIPTSVRDSVSATDSIGPENNILEEFFPFDPFHLPRYVFMLYMKTIKRKRIVFNFF